MKKQPGRTWIEVNNEVHMFVVDDQDHPQISWIEMNNEVHMFVVDDQDHPQISEIHANCLLKHCTVLYICILCSQNGLHNMLSN